MRMKIVKKNLSTCNNGIHMRKCVHLFWLKMKEHDEYLSLCLFYETFPLKAKIAKEKLISSMPLFFCGQLRKAIDTMHMEKTKGVRKGAWTYEEDKLLKDCINKYGEGKWHLVPQRAGLNRCRKSCRLRWLNYLNPTINRESFSEDEVDMMLRLHKLLGNRWSLIAARLPGRTANDVKNYWHTNLRKKAVPKKIEEKKKPMEITMKAHEVIKPQPRTFSSRSSLWLNGKHAHNFAKPIMRVSTKDVPVAKDGDKDCTMLPINGDGDCAAQPYSENSKWWESLLNVSNDKIGSCSLLQEKEYSNLEFENVEKFLNEDPNVNVSECYWESFEFDSLLDILN